MRTRTKTWATGLLAAAILGATFGTAHHFATTASAHLDGLVHVYPYSYRAYPCSQAADPISIVFYQNANATNTSTHAHHHGSWTNHQGTQQYFYNHGCVPKDDQNSNGGLLSNRYHMRYFWNQDLVAEPWLGKYATATPHWETVDLNCSGWWDPNHKVENGTPGGFVKGKWELGWRWHNWNNGGGQHLLLEQQYWGNRADMPQCEGTAANDGWVDFIRVVGSGH